MDDRELGVPNLLNLLKVIAVDSGVVDHREIALDQDVVTRDISTIRGRLFERDACGDRQVDHGEGAESGGRSLSSRELWSLLATNAVNLLWIGPAPV